MVNIREIKAILSNNAVRSVNIPNSVLKVSIAMRYDQLVCTFHNRKKHGEIICTKVFEDVEPKIQEMLYEAVTATYRSRQRYKYTRKNAVQKNKDLVLIIKALKRMGMDAVMATSTKGDHSKINALINGKRICAIAKNSQYSNFSVNPSQLSDANIDQFLFIGDGTAWFLDNWQVAMLATDKRLTNNDLWYCINGKNVCEHTLLTVAF